MRIIMAMKMKSLVFHEDSAEVEPDSDTDDKDYNGIFDAEDSEEESSESSNCVVEMSSKEEWEELQDDGVICRDNHGTHHSSKGSGSHIHKIGMQNLSEKTSTKRKRTCDYKEDEVVRILADSILDQAEAPFKEGNEPVKEPTLPLKFTFGVERKLKRRRSWIN
ncbi:hypothetical protein OIU85_026411 [Salix viminalis]|uniref:Uncharacterized protein n=1 Tax=Salix viminalis TaxID=40686 RepID=A0A9Q0TNN7_SALVM|nr:hypothetical protein OIU85_026411 [Salix viminalis]